MTKIPVRALTLGVADPHPLSPQVLQKAATALHHATAGVTEAGYEVQTERLSTRPLLSDLSDWHPPALVRYAAELQEALDDLAVPFFSLGPALPRDAAPERTELLADLIAGRPALNASVMMATAEGGLDMGAARAAARIMKRLAEETEEGFGNFNFAALACVGPGGPFLPAAYHAVGAPANLTVALQGSGIVAEAFRGGVELPEVTERIKDKLTEHAGPIVALVAAQAAEHDLDFGGIDLSPAPDGEDSIVMAMELAGHGPLGGPGTLALAAALTAGVQGTSLPTCGYCGLMLPLMEDVALARRWEEGRFGLDQLLAYSAVCGTGLDTIPLAGDCSTGDLVDIICDVASLALRQRKPLSARLLPVPGKVAGDRTEFSSPYLVNTVIKPLRPPP